MNRQVLARLAAAVVVALGIALALWRWRGETPSDADAPAGAALVTLAPVSAATVRETVTAYGVVAAGPGAGRTLTTPRAVIVEQVLVTPGQKVAAGQALLRVADTAATGLAFSQASEALAAAEHDLQRVQRLYDQKLAADDQLSAARKTLADARAALAAQRAIGAGGGHATVKAPIAGVVALIPVAAGAAVAADAPLLTLVADGDLIADLGVEPAQAARLAPGEAVSLRSTLDPSVIARTHLTVVGQAIDPGLRLIKAGAPISDPRLPLGANVEATVTVAVHPGLLVPRNAVVFDDTGAHLFVIAQGKARLVPVTPGAEQADQLEVAGAVKAGESVAVEGAYQLSDGAAVRTAPR